MRKFSTYPSVRCGLEKTADPGQAGRSPSAGEKAKANEIKPVSSSYVTTLPSHCPSPGAKMEQKSRAYPKLSQGYCGCLKIDLGSSKVGK